MQPFQQRIVDEKKDLDEKRDALSAFFSTDIFNKLGQSEKDRLRMQDGIMSLYSEILGQRIAAL